MLEPPRFSKVQLCHVFRDRRSFLHRRCTTQRNVLCTFLSSTEVDDMIRKSTNLLLTRTLSNCLHYGIKKKNVGLAEVPCAHTWLARQRHFVTITRSRPSWCR